MHLKRLLNMKVTLAFALLFIALSGCGAFYKLAIGVEDPKPHTDNTQLTTYAKDTYPSYPFIRVAPEYLTTLLKGKYKPDWEPGFRPIQFMCFDNTGKLIAQWASCEGELDKFVLSDTIPKSKYKSFDDITFEKLYPQLQNETGKNIEINTYKNNDINYVVYWTMWTDRQSKKLVKTLEQYIKNSKNKSELILVNADYYNLPKQQQQ